MSNKNKCNDLCSKLCNVLLHTAVLLIIILTTTKLTVSFAGATKFIRLFTFLILWYMMIISILSTYYEKKGAYAAMVILYSLNLLNLALMLKLAESQLFMFAAAIAFSVLGLLVSAYGIPSKLLKEVVTEVELPKFYARSEPTDALTKKEIEHAAQVTKTIVKKTFAPARFVASNKGENFHSPKCDWAKKIFSKNQIWFKDAAEAESKGYKKCGLCIR